MLLLLSELLLGFFLTLHWSSVHQRRSKPQTGRVSPAPAYLLSCCSGKTSMQGWDRGLLSLTSIITIV